MARKSEFSFYYRGLGPKRAVTCKACDLPGRALHVQKARSLPIFHNRAATQQVQSCSSRTTLPKAKRAADLPRLRRRGWLKNMGRTHRIKTWPSSNGKSCITTNYRLQAFSRLFAEILLPRPINFLKFLRGQVRYFEYTLLWSLMFTSFLLAFRWVTIIFPKKAKQF